MCLATHVLETMNREDNAMNFEYNKVQIIAMSTKTDMNEKDCKNF